MTYARCETCHEWDFMTRHRCAPEWLVQQADSSEETLVDAGWPEHASSARGLDSEAAALAYGERLDECERDVLESHDGVLIWVAPAGKPDEVERWRVTAEAVVQYAARRDPDPTQVDAASSPCDKDT